MRHVFGLYREENSHTWVGTDESKMKYTLKEKLPLHHTPKTWTILKWDSILFKHLFYVNLQIYQILEILRDNSVGFLQEIPLISTPNGAADYIVLKNTDVDNPELKV